MKYVIAALSICSFLIACGESSTSEKSLDESLLSVAKYSDLPTCSADNKGNLYLVDEDNKTYMCSGSRWFALDYQQTNSCEIKNLSKGIAVFCNGDSVGVAFSGVDGAVGDSGISGKNGISGENCSVLGVDDLSITVACLGDTNVISLEDTTSEELLINDLTISGVSQKGPFLKGSEVYAYSLLNGQTLRESGSVFSGTITDNDGSFTISSISLPSSFVSLTVNGFFRNEVTGKNSSLQITLDALTDLSNDRSQVNVNLVTHLEYDRVVYLVTRKDKSVREAKKIAEKELFDAFGMDSLNLEYAEDLNLWGEDDASAAMLALSIILLADRSESELTADLFSIRDDLADDGVISDSTILIQSADWLINERTNDNFEGLRTRLELWNQTIPNFEKYLNLFLKSIYDGHIGSCSESNEDSVIYVDFPQSRYYAQSYQDTSISTVRFICKNKEWKIANDKVSNLYGIDCDKSGKIVNGLISPNKKYVCDSDTFRTAYPKEVWVNRGCVSYNKSDSVDYMGYTYHCGAGVWRLKLVDEDKMGSFYDERDGYLYPTVVIGEQTWMAENLQYHDSIASPNLKNGTYCLNNSLDSCHIYGYLYDIFAAYDAENPHKQQTGLTYFSLDSKKGICPEGWHIPDTTEFSLLEKASPNGTLCGFMSAYNHAALLSSGCGNDLADYDPLGFSVIQSGYRVLGPFFYNDYYGGFYWTVNFDDHSAEIVIGPLSGLNQTNISYESDIGNYSWDDVSVRCLKD